MSRNLIATGIKQGWRYLDARTVTAEQSFSADVVIVGSGAGGAMAAEQLSAAGLDVIIVEMGSLQEGGQFQQQERWAYPALYQDGAGRKSEDQAIGILQGRTVGGSTTVNWTTSIRTPEKTLAYWRSEFGLPFESEQLLPYFEKAEQRLHINPWPIPANANNEKLKVGCERLGWEYTVISRNVNGCANLGYCGMGCPLNAKQSMLVSTIPQAMKQGAMLVTNLSARRLRWSGTQVQELEAVPVDEFYKAKASPLLKFKAKHFIVAAGAIGSPALLLRSMVPDASGLLGKRTCLHPSLVSGAMFDEVIAGHTGAPQSVYSDQFVWPKHEGMGFKLEVPPLHPVLMATKLSGHGTEHAELMQKFNQLQVTIALLRDGFHPQSQGGEVRLDGQGEPLLRYDFTPYFWQGARQALLAMAELQFAAGAKAVQPMHQKAALYTSFSKAKAAIASFEMKPYQVALASAHVMGGCAMSSDPSKGVVRPDGGHHQLQNLSVLDGSVLPTSLGANPQLTIYALTLWQTEQLKAALLRGR